MPLPTIPGVARVSVGGPICGGGRWSNTLHFRRSDLADSDGVQQAALAAAVATFYGAAVMPICGAPTAVESVSVTPLDGTSGALVVPAPIVASGAGNTLPPEVSAVITVRSGLRGRRARGRIFLPAFLASKLDSSGLLLDATIAALLAEMGVMTTALSVLGWQFGIASYGHSRVLVRPVVDRRVVDSSWTPEFTPSTSQSMDKKLDVQRHRKG